jgi:hypothetical protein
LLQASDFSIDLRKYATNIHKFIPQCFLLFNEATATCIWPLVLLTLRLTRYLCKSAMETKAGRQIINSVANDDTGPPSIEVNACRMIDSVRAKDSPASLFPFTAFCWIAGIAVPSCGPGS